MNDIQKMLEINQKVESGGAFNNKKDDYHRMIENYDGQYQQPIMIQEDMKPYSAQEDMERIKKIEKDGGYLKPESLKDRKIPKEIIESIINEPLNIKPIDDPRMQKLEEKIADKMSGINASKEIFNKIEQQEKNSKEKINENNARTVIDYGIIKAIIEEVVDSKLSAIKNSLNESRTQQYVPAMKFLSFKDKFYFVDKEDNVFECVMSYKGKNHKK